MVYINTKKRCNPPGRCNCNVVHASAESTEIHAKKKKKKNPADVNGAGDFNETQKWTNQRNKN